MFESISRSGTVDSTRGGSTLFKVKKIYMYVLYIKIISFDNSYSHI